MKHELRGRGQAPAALQSRLVTRTDLATRLFRQDRAFFYSAFVVEEKRA